MSGGELILRDGSDFPAVPTGTGDRLGQAETPKTDALAWQTPSARRRGTSHTHLRIFHACEVFMLQPWRAAVQVTDKPPAAPLTWDKAPPRPLLARPSLARQQVAPAAVRGGSSLAHSLVWAPPSSRLTSEPPGPVPEREPRPLCPSGPLSPARAEDKGQSRVPGCGVSASNARQVGPTNKWLQTPCSDL